MAARLTLIALFGVLAGASVASQVQRVTPVEKVIELLETLERKVEAEGAAEATAYDKFSCFCKEQADEKLYAKEKSTKILAEQDKALEVLAAEIVKLNGEISELGMKIQTLEGEIASDTTARAATHKIYQEEAADMSGAIDAVNRALDALKTSKGSMAGKTEMEALVQVREVATLGLAMVQKSSKSALSQKSMAVLASLAGQPGKAYEYEYHSNDIITTLEELRKTFIGNKDELDQGEFDSKALFETKLVDQQNEKQFAEKDKAEKEALQQEKTDEEAKTKEDRMQEQKEFDADAAFLVVLTADCEEKAQMWDQRSTTRAGELTAISQAMTQLKEGVKPNYGANKKLNGLVQTGSKAVSFLQLGSRKAVSKQALQTQSAKKVEAFLMEKATQLKSAYLSSLALRVQVSEDHFVKVRQLIKDLLEKLKSDEESEAQQKGFCDRNMAAAIAKRDTNQGQIESDTAIITALNAEDKQLEADIVELSAGIAANLKAKNEATQLREDDKAENAQTVTDAETGKTAVEFALTTLKEFYGGAAGVGFVQSAFTPAARNAAANMDRSGKTVADLAPDVFSENYAGSQDSSKGIVGMLEVILSDFDRTIESVTTQESREAGDHEAFVIAIDTDTGIKKLSVKLKDTRRTEIEGLVMTQVGLKTEAEGELKNASEELAVLHAQCVAGEETYEQRVEQRNKEIAALKEAHSILEDWQA